MSSRPPSHHVLVVESGVHRLARAALIEGRNRVGPSSDNEIVLSDLGPSATAFAIQSDGDTVILQPAAVPVGLSRRRVLAPGRSRRCKAGTRFTSGGVTFSIERDSRAPAATPAAGPRLLWSVPVVAGCGFLAALVSVLASPTAAPPVAASAASDETTGSLPAASARPGPEHAEAVLPTFRQRLAATGLDNVTLTVRPEGAIEARGQIAPQQDQAWREASRWFDGAVAGHAVLVDQVEVAAAPTLLTVQAVWPGRSPYVIDGRGDKLFIGSILPNGWTISGIDAKRVLVKRGTQSMAVRF